MVHISDVAGAVAAAGKFSTAITTMTGKVDTVVEGLVLNTRSESALDRALGTKLGWIRTTFANGIAEAASQAGVTRHAAVVGTTALRNADTDGAAVVRTTEV